MKAKYDPMGLADKEPEFVCKYCQKVFTKSTALGGHISKVHKDLVSSEKAEQIKEEQHDGKTQIGT